LREYDCIAGYLTCLAFPLPALSNVEKEKGATVGFNRGAKEFAGLCVPNRNKSSFFSCPVNPGTDLNDHTSSSVPHCDLVLCNRCRLHLVGRRFECDLPAVSILLLEQRGVVLEDSEELHECSLENPEGFGKEE
jgi:hypothetical protein